MDLLRSATSSELATIKEICTLSGTFRVVVLRGTSRFKFERDYKLDTSLIKSRRWLKKDAVLSINCAAVVHVWPLLSKEELEENSLSDTVFEYWLTKHKLIYTTTDVMSPSRLDAGPGHVWIQKYITFQISPVDETTFPCFLTKTTLLMIISEFRSTKLHKNIIYFSKFGF